MRKTKLPKELPWSIGIKHASDGAIMYLFGDNKIIESNVYDFSNGHPGAMMAMLYDIRDQFLNQTRYDKQRVMIRIEHGDKYDCKGCEICKPK